MKIRWKKLLPIVIGLLILGFAGTLFYLRHRLDASLPMLAGEVALAGPGAEIRVLRDARGLARIEAASLPDLAFAEGFLHAQERFFQMDLARRFADGALAELVGERALELDRDKRRLGCRAVARRMAGRLAPSELELFQAYARGVNAGLAALDDDPPEYLVLRRDPAPWAVEDSLLVGFYFFQILSLNPRYEQPVGVMDACLPRELVDFLTPDVAPNDRVLVGSPAAEPPPLPGPEVFDLARAGHARPTRDLVRCFDDVGLGSNNWAISAARSKTGRAILANDPHLNIGVPNAWYRLEFAMPGLEVVGVSAPGVPGIVIGANERIAWGLTNGMADHEDLVVIEVDPENEGRYRTPEGFEAFGERRETIAVAGGDPVELSVRETRWGPVVGADADGRPLALRSTSLDPETHDFALLRLMTATTLEEALEIGASWQGPSQNLVLADDRGRVAWVLTGRLPQRVGFDGKRPVSWADGTRRWEGARDESERPRLVDPEDGLVYSANNRMVAIAAARGLSRIWVPAWRAERIAELLAAADRHDERDLLAIQLDARDAQFDRYRELVLGLHPQEPADAAQRAALGEIRAWNGRADLDSRGLPLLRLYSERLREALIAPLVQPCGEKDPKFVYNWPNVDEVVFRLMAERPRHLLDPAFASFEDLARAAFAKLVAEVDADRNLGIAMRWGAFQQPPFEHPLGKVPPLNHFFNLPREGLPGDANTVRAQTNRYGASMRMVVSPGALDSAILESPGGQSGHFRSPHYGDLHADWVAGRPTPMKLGPVVHRLVLHP